MNISSITVNYPTPILNLLIDYENQFKIFFRLLCKIHQSEPDQMR